MDIYFDESPGNRRITFALEKSYRCSECGASFHPKSDEIGFQRRLHDHAQDHFTEPSDAPR